MINSSPQFNVLDEGNSAVVTSANASPSSPWVGDWFATRDEGFVRQLSVLASNVNTTEEKSVQFLEHKTGFAGNVSSVSTSSGLSKIESGFYLASISREDPNANVTMVTGLGLTWVQVGSSQNATRRVDIWRGVGTPISGGTVTATFSQNADASHIAVTILSNVNLNNPINDFDAEQGNSTTPLTEGITVAERGAVLMAVGLDNRDFTEGAGYTLLSEEVSSSGTIDGLGVQLKLNSTGGTENPSSTVDSSVLWCALSVAINPGPEPMGGIFTFEYSEDGITPTISEARTIRSFSSVRDFDLLNAGKFYRIKFEPDRTMDAGESVFITTTQRRLNDGAFVRLLTQELEETSAALPHIASFLKGLTVNGVSANFRLGSLDQDNMSTTPPLANTTTVGTYQDARGLTSLLVTLISDEPLTDVQIRWSSDGINQKSGLLGISLIPEQLIENVPVLGNIYVYLAVLTTIVDDFYRLEYTSGNPAPSVFETAIWTYHTNFPGSFIQLEQSLNTLSTALLTRAVVAGVGPNNNFKNARIQGAHAGNSSITPLNASGVFRGVWFQWDEGYVKALVDMVTDTSGTLFIDFSQDETPVDGDESSVTESLSIPFNPAVTPLLRRHIPVQSKWIRMRYQNDAVAQTEFSLDVSFVVQDPGLVMLPLDILPVGRNLAGIVRSVPTLRSADGNSFQETPVSALGNPQQSIREIHDDILIEPLSSAKASQTVVGTTPIQIDSAPLANRRVVSVNNDGPLRIAVGHSPSMTFDALSIRMNPGSSRTFGIDDSLPLYAVCENLGGVQTTSNRNPASASGTATNPNNAISSNNVYANITANGQTINATGFTAGTTNAIASIRLGIELNRPSGITETAVFQDSRTGTGAGTSTVATTASVVAVTNHLYIAAISKRQKPTSTTVTGVSGLGLTWTQLTTQPSDDGNRTLDIWYAIGTVTGNSVVTATFSGSSVNSHISVTRYSNVNPTTPISDFKVGAANDSSPTTPALSGIDKGIAYMAVNSANRTMTAGAGYTLISSELTNDGGDSDSLGVERKSLTATGSETPTATLSGNAHWAAISLVINPAVAANPIVTLSYTLSAVPGATSLNVTPTSASDQIFFANITGDRSWVFGDIANVSVIATGLTIGLVQANVDHLFIELTDTTGSTSRVSLWQGAKAVT